MSGLQQKRAVDARGIHQRWIQDEFEQPRVGRTAHDQLRLMLAGFAEKSDDLLELQPRQRDIVHRHDLIAGLQSGFGGRRSGQRLENDHAPGQNGYHRAESLALGTSPFP